jgi:hypothetical protein
MATIQRIGFVVFVLLMTFYAGMLWGEYKAMHAPIPPGWTVRQIN